MPQNQNFKEDCISSWHFSKKYLWSWIVLFQSLSKWKINKRNDSSHYKRKSKRRGGTEEGEGKEINPDSRNKVSLNMFLAPCLPAGWGINWNITRSHLYLENSSLNTSCMPIYKFLFLITGLLKIDVEPLPLSIPLWYLII